MALPPNFRQQLLEQLAQKGARANCEICNVNNWSVLEQAVSVQITDLSPNFVIPPPQIPSAGMICNNCGNVRLFALGALGLLPEPEAEKKETK